MSTPTVADYMVRNVVSIPPEMSVGEAIDKLIQSNFHGFPIAEKGYLLGFVTAKDLLRHTHHPEVPIREIMRFGSICVIPSMSMDDATRVLFRYGLRNLPVVDENKKLVGIISNIDIVRSQIEKSRPGKVMSVKNFLESQNGIKMHTENMFVPLKEIIPSQKEVYMDELMGRQFEIKRGLNEPLILIKRRHGYLVVDGHHRVMAAKKLGLEKFRSIVLIPNNYEVTLGLEKTAEKWGLRSLDDVKIIEGSKHPFIEITTMLMPENEMEKINKRLTGN